MCGIAGFIGAGSEKELVAMAEILKHRGPDAQEVWQDRVAGVGLAHTRLAVIDLSSDARQPMVDVSGRVRIVFNGEIYNYKELRAELFSYPFKTSSDTEVILAAYHTWGIEGFRRLSGMFAFALYDESTKTLLLARDRFGKKPLYWTHKDTTLVFGSELKVFSKHESVARSVDPRSLALYLSREYIPTPRSIYRDIQKLEPGTILLFEKGKIRFREIWPMREEEVTNLSEDEALRRFDALLSSAVKRRLVSDVPLGIFLSGGIDSSTIAYYAVQESTKKPVKTFSIGFAESAFDESEDALCVARHLGTDHHAMKFSVDDALTLIPSIPDVLDEPVADASILPTLLLSRFTREYVTVALGGDGADELLLGYQTFLAEQYASLWACVPSFLKTAIRTVTDALPASYGYFGLDFKAQKFTHDFDNDRYIRHMQWLGSFRETELSELLTPQYREWASSLYKDVSDMTREFPPDNSNALSYLYLRTYMMDDVLVKVDRASMRYALEVRTPFLDYDLASFVLSLPATLKFRRGKGKYLLRTLMRERLPSRVLMKSKQGFSVPMGQWLRGPLRSLMTDLLSSKRIRKDGFFDAEFVELLMEEHLRGRHDNHKKLWTLMVFQLWYDRWVKHA